MDVKSSIKVQYTWPNEQIVLIYDDNDIGIKHLLLLKSPTVSGERSPIEMLTVSAAPLGFIVTGSCDQNKVG